MDLTRAVARCEIFRDLPPAALSRIAGVAFERTLDKGAVLFAENEPGAAFYLLARGAVKLYRAEDGHEVIIRMVRKDEMFGEAVLFGRADYPVYAQAVRPSGVVGIPRAPMIRLLDDHDFRDQFIAALIGRLRYFVDHVHVLSIPRLEARFFRYVGFRFGRRTRYDIDLSRKDVASALGVTPEAFSRLLTRLRASGRVRWEGRVLTVSPDAWEQDESL